MKYTIPIKNDPKKLQAFLFTKGPKLSGKQVNIWNVLHNKTLKTSGRGGKGHFVGGVQHGWNRKGRW